ncbi:MAG: hypothetical protein LC776_15630, partial [Acidobacteria bacterium]|nr:hypothetical protein [Acidobacteriota bacterium]
SCLGNTGHHVLGKRQLYALPIWVIGLAYLEWGMAPNWTTGAGMYYLAGLVLILGFQKLMHVVHVTKLARSTRRAMDESTILRPPMFRSVEGHP